MGTTPEDPSTTAAPLLEVRDLAIEFFTPHGTIRVVEGASFALEPGETLGIVGESGSGKSVTCRAIFGLVRPPSGRVAAGSIRYRGQELLDLPSAELRDLTGREISMIFQEPLRSLDPAFTVGEQIAETVRGHTGSSRRDAWRRAVDMLELVGIPSARTRASDYPHQFSGGMAQRVMLAIALSCSPKVLIADEPTTALDVTVQSQVLDLIVNLQEELGLGVVFISHDLGVVAEMCDRVAVMYAGQIVEQARADELFFRPRHPYTAALLHSVPVVDSGSRRLAAIPGIVPPAHAWPSGCRFHPRCTHAIERCAVDAPALTGSSNVRCLRTESLSLRGVQ
jgi:peptide/nickel transport system ATP-binding protein